MSQLPETVGTARYNPCFEWYSPQNPPRCFMAFDAPMDRWSSRLTGPGSFYSFVLGALFARSSPTSERLARTAVMPERNISA
jgi:hypothetical protein